MEEIGEKEEKSRKEKGSWKVGFGNVTRLENKDKDVWKGLKRVGRNNPDRDVDRLKQ